MVESSIKIQKANEYELLWPYMELIFLAVCKVNLYGQYSKLYLTFLWKYTFQRDPTMGQNKSWTLKKLRNMYIKNL